MKNRLKRGDWIVIGVVFLSAVILASAMFIGSTSDDLYAEVWQTGQLVERIKLEPDCQKTITITTEDGHYNDIVMDGLTVYMRRADCPDQVCVRTGKLTRAGQNAVCLPHRVIVKIIGDKAEMDAVAQ